MKNYLGLDLFFFWLNLEQFNYFAIFWDIYLKFLIFSFRFCDKVGVGQGKGFIKGGFY